MAVDNPPHPAPAANPRLAAAKDVVIIISGLGGFGAVLIAAIALVFSMTIAPLRDDLRAFRQEMQRGFEAVGVEFKAVDAQFKAIDAEFKAVRQDLAALSERLVRLETLLQQGAGQGQAPAAPDTQTE